MCVSFTCPLVNRKSVILLESDCWSYMYMKHCTLKYCVIFSSDISGQTSMRFSLHEQAVSTSQNKIQFKRYAQFNLSFSISQVRLAETRGAIGVILFSDPSDCTNGNQDQVYPNGWYLPPSGTQRGTIYIGNGDPMTPGYPAIGTNLVFQEIQRICNSHLESNLA